MKYIIKVKQKAKYPSAEKIKQVCYEDYLRVIKTYDKIYDKVNIALAFCGTVLLVILSNFDYTAFYKIKNVSNKIIIYIYLFSSAIAVLFIIISIVKLLLLMKSREVKVVNSIDLQNQRLYFESLETTNMWLIDKYNRAINSLRQTIEEKQKQYNCSVTMLIIAIITFAISLIFKKGIQ